MSSETELHGDPLDLTLEDLVAVQPRHLRGRVARGMRGPDGERPGRGRARTLDFDGLSRYEYGDDIRMIDWRASLRSGETTVRRFAAASHRARMIALELEPSLYFGTDERLMAKTACLTAAWLAWTSDILNEPVGLSVAGETLAPRRGRRHVLRLLDVIAAAFRTGGDTAAPPLDLQALAVLTGREDELCVVGELPDDPAPLAAAGRTLSTVRTLRYFPVEDPIATRPPVPGRYPVRGADGMRQVLHVREGMREGGDAVAALRDAGWQVRHARDLLPGRTGP